MKLAALLLLLLTQAVAAHQQSTSYSGWDIDGASVRVALRVSQLDLTRVGLHPGQLDYLSQVGRYFGAAVSVRAGDQRCAMDEPAVGNGEPGWLRVRLQWRCAADARAPVLRFVALFEQAPNHVHLASIRQAGAEDRSVVFTESRSEWQAAAGGRDGGHDFGGYLRLGIEHILSGWDHLCFLLVLLICARRLSELAWLVTGFTLGHSVTLFLSFHGLAIADTRAVEWVIALSILVLAVENVWRGERTRAAWPFVLFAGVLACGLVAGVLALPAAAGLALFLLAYLALLRAELATPRVQMLVTVAFGLFHGFGFAGALTQLQVPPEQLLVSLLGFNLGVEAGQLLVLLPVLPLVYLARRHAPAWLYLPNGIAGGAACFWLVQRSLG